MNRKILIIDRTLPELVKNKGYDKVRLKYFARSLLQIGCDILEINAYTIFVMRNCNCKYIYRVERQADLKKIKKKNILAVIVSYSDYNNMKDILKGYKLILEIQASEFWDIYNSGKINSIIEQNKINSFRVIGLHNTEAYTFIDKLLLIKKLHNIEIDICASNKSGLATAIALEAFDKGAEYVTSSFCGCGGSGGYARLEEIIVALKILYGVEKSSKTPYLSKLADEFEQLTGKAIHPQKPVLGKSIFKCESGIHVHGILRDPSTYEPYDPELVGKEREFILGKHSGRSIYRQVSFSLQFQ